MDGRAGKSHGLKGPNLTRGDHLVRGDWMTTVMATTLGKGEKKGKLLATHPLRSVSLSVCVTLQSFWKIGQIGL